MVWSYFEDGNSSTDEIQIEKNNSDWMCGYLKNEDNNSMTKPSSIYTEDIITDFRIGIFDRVELNRYPGMRAV